MKRFLPCLPLLAVMIGFQPAVLMADHQKRSDRYGSFRSANRAWGGLRRSGGFDRRYEDLGRYRTPPIGIPAYGPSRAGQHPPHLEECIREWYLTYLGREPEPNGYASWIHHFHSGATLTQVQIGIMSSPECFARFGNDPHAYVRFLFHQVAGGECSPQELETWTALFCGRYHGDRSQFCQDLLLSHRGY